MQITKSTFTKEALKFITPGKDYDREFIAIDVASALANQLYDELGGIKAMTLIEVDWLKGAFYHIGLSLIDWGKCNRQAHPDDWADTDWRIKDETPIGVENEPF